MQIGDRIISTKEKPFIIAEAGINHNGEIEMAFKMIETAKNIGFEAIKFQTFKAEEFNIDSTQTYTYKSQGKTITEPMLDMFKRYEFNKDEWYKIKKKCDAENIIFLSTPQNYSDLELLLDIDISAIKVGSDDFTNIPLLKKYSETDLPLILSCGMADLGEVYTSLDTVGALDGQQIALLLCTSQYPTPVEDVNLLKLKTLANAFPHITLGFSDHTQGNLAASMAIAFGACIFEKHFTLNHDLAGPDHWFSENPESLKVWHDSIFTAWNLLGNECVRPTAREREMRVVMRRSIVVKKNLKIGDILSMDNLGLYRPGNGMKPSELISVIGKTVRHDMKKGQLLQWSDIL